MICEKPYRILKYEFDTGYEIALSNLPRPDNWTPAMDLGWKCYIENLNYSESLKTLIEKVG